PNQVAGVADLLADTEELLRAITHCFDEGVAMPPSASGLSTQDVADLAFVGRTEMVEIRDALMAAREHRNSWKQASEADRAGARAPRPLVAVGGPLGETLGLEAKGRRFFDLEDALEIRRRYGKLWLEAVRCGDPQGANLIADLAHFTDLIAE